MASAGATYHYTNSANKNIEDKTKLFFVEVSPGFALNLPGNIHLGAGYRVTYMNLARLRQADSEPADLDFSLSGYNAASFRVGAQWIAVDDRSAAATERKGLQFGLSYRHETDVDVSADEGKVLTLDVTDMKSTFILPAKLIGGVRGDLGRWGMAVDVERNLNDQNQESIIEGQYQGQTVPAPNIFDWSNSWTLRGGLEFRLLDKGPLATRVGYALDTQTSSTAYPSSFGTPPTKTQIVTAGVGYDAGSWQANFAYAYRFGNVKVTSEDTAGARSCPFCSKFGEYDIKLHGLYGDFSYDF